MKLFNIIKKHISLLLLCFVYNSIDGVVVCEEFEEVLLNAWQEEEEQAEKRRAEVCSIY